MTALDTNVIVRLLTDDEPAQTTRAAALLRANAVLVPITVLLETEWVLRAAYELDRKTIEGALRNFLALPNVTVADDATVYWALDAYGQGMDLADALHLASARPGGERFATFDKGMRRLANRQHGVIPVVEP